MTRRLERKVALVTAAGQGIGRAIAEAFVAEAAKVIATDIESSKLEGLVGAELHKLDVRSTSQVAVLANALAEAGIVPNVLVNCAGYVHNGSVLECSQDDWNFSVDLNVTSMHRTVRAFLPGMLKNGGGSIINISSAVSSIRGVPNRYAYGATKAAVIGLTKAVAADFIKQGIRANAICPGTIQSPSLDQRIAALAQQTGRSLEDIRREFVERQPMGRLGTPAEVAALAVFLASDESRFVTGQPHLVDGGMTDGNPYEG
jgi:2-keto-3-deoxy-L-fuconate dehydrogenase